MALGALLLTLPLGPTATEIATGLALAVTALCVARGGGRERAPLDEPAALLALGFATTAFAPGSALDALGRIWAIAPVWCVPILLRASPRLPWSTLGLGAWVLALPAVGAQVARVAQDGMWEEAAVHGWFDHHLTLAGALLVPLAVAGSAVGAVRWATWAVVGVSAMLLASGSLAGVIAGGGILLVGGLASRRLGVSLVGGLLALAAGVAWWGWGSGLGALRERSLFWATGAEIWQRGIPPGTQRDWMGPIQHRMDPQLDFAYHAHDTWIQILVDGRLFAWMALVWGTIRLLRTQNPWIRAAVVGLILGGTVQDGLGDLEVVRSLAVWLPLWLYFQPDPPKEDG